MDDKIKINLNMVGESYPRTIRREEEELVRAAAKQVNTRLAKYQELYRNIPLEKALVMVAYEFSERLLRMNSRNDTEPYKAKIEELTQVLEEYFRE